MRKLVQLMAFATLAIVALAGCGGGGGGTPSPSGVTVAISPKPGSVIAGAQLTFGATVTGAANHTVNWSVVESGGGTITSAGVYTAPATAGTYHVKAISQADPTASDTASVVVSPVPAVTVEVRPANATVTTGNHQSFTAVVLNSNDHSVAWTVQPGGAGGSINASGVYTAPAVLGAQTTDTIVATSNADPTKSNTAIVTVTASTVVSVVVSPSYIEVDPSATVDITATVNGDGSHSGVTWSVVETGGGTVNASGHYVAPATGGVYHVRATSVADTSKYADTTVVVKAGSGTIVVQ